MRLCNFPGCERLPGHGTLHACWNSDTQTWQPLTEQRTPAERMRDRRDKINRMKAERIADEALTQHYGRDEYVDDPIDVRGLVMAGILAALTEQENNR